MAGRVHYAEPFYQTLDVGHGLEVEMKRYFFLSVLALTEPIAAQDAMPFPEAVGPADDRAAQQLLLDDVADVVEIGLASGAYLKEYRLFGELFKVHIRTHKGDVWLTDTDGNGRLDHLRGVAVDRSVRDRYEWDR